VGTLGSLNNELGVPLTVLRADDETRFLVLEMGARGVGHLAELTAIAPLDVAVVLNVGTAHLGEFGSQDAIAQAKGELVEGLRAYGTAVLNADDPRVAAMASRTPADAAGFITFGAADDADVRLGAVKLDRLGRPRFELTTTAGSAEVVLPLVGGHQAINAAAATAAAQIVDVTVAEAAGALAAARLSKWRMELTELPSGLTVLNDSYNANPESMRAALDALAAIEPSEGGRRIAVLGEMRELGEGSAAAHFEVGVHAAARGIDLVLVVGGPAASIEMGARTIETAFVEDNEEAVAWLHEHLTPRDVVLLKASRGARLDEVADALA
jgi:UDP-N-acetylmuramoyl-tripeptide--D-alanyl-D-alanine ligase